MIIPTCKVHMRIKKEKNNNIAIKYILLNNLEETYSLEYGT